MTVERFFFLLGEIIPTAKKKLHSDRLFSFLVEICQQCCLHLSTICHQLGKSQPKNLSLFSWIGLNS